MRRNIFTCLIIAALAIAPSAALAASESTNRLVGAGAQAGYSTGGGDAERIFTTISLIINVALSLMGVIFLVLVVYAGYMWMIAGGDEGKVETSKHTMTRAVVGLAITLCAYAIANYVVPAIYCSSNPTAQTCLKQTV